MDPSEDVPVPRLPQKQHPDLNRHPYSNRNWRDLLYRFPPYHGWIQKYFHLLSNYKQCRHCYNFLLIHTKIPVSVCHHDPNWVV
jgi:hypothetical protein